MAMLQMERWIFDSKRGLPRDTRNPQQSDQALRSFLEGTPDNTSQLEEQEFAVTKKKTRRKVKKSTPATNIVVDVDDDALSDAEVVVPEKKPKRARAAKVLMNSANVFDDDSHFDVVTSENLEKKQKATNKPPPKPPTVKTQVPEYNAEDFNKLLDAKLEKMFSTIATNQANLAKSFTVALEEQRKEFVEMQRAPPRVPGLSTTSAFNSSQSGEVNLSLSPTY